METQRLSLRETAEVFGVSPSHLSESVRAGKNPKSIPLQEHVVYAEDGRISHFEVPLAMLPMDSYGESREGDPSPRPNEQTPNERSGVRSEGGEPGESGKSSTESMIEVSVKGGALEAALGVDSERENPAGVAVSEALMGGALSGVAREVVSEMVGGVRQLLDGADPEEAMMIGASARQFLVDLAPLIGGSAVGYQYRERHPVTMVSAALLAGAGIELLLKGDDSRFVQALKSGLPGSARDESQEPQPQSGMEAEAVPSTVGDGEVPGDGVPIDVEAGLDRIGSDSEDEEGSQ